MTRDDIQELRAMIAQIRCQVKQGALPSGLVVCYANAESADAFERIAEACDKMLEDQEKSEKRKKMSRAEALEVVALFNTVCPSLPSVKQLTDARITALTGAKALLGDTSFATYFEAVEASDFLSGRSGKWKGATFDWILKKSNLVKVLEGNFANARGDTQTSSFDINDFWNAALDRSRRVMEGV